MKDPVQRYLDKKADLARWPLVSGATEDVHQVVVIPSLAENDYLFATLDTIAQNDPAALSHTLVICVVNNRAAPHAEPANIENNAQTLRQLDALRTDTPFRLAYVDASSPGRELPPDEGVGLARKIGLDWGLLVLHEAGSLTCPGTPSLLLSLDADTLVQPDYLTAIRQAFDSRSLWAAVVDYAHPVDGRDDETAPIVAYELFLRYHVLGLRYAGSPYAFPSIGSTMACRAAAYVAVSGMNRRKAGEDFYFLQQLAKTGGVAPITTTTVHPSARASDRVPFGTGPRVARFARSDADPYLLYHPESYSILKQWLTAVSARRRQDADAILREADAIAPQLAHYLRNTGFEQVWDRLRRHSPDDTALMAQFHRWFDGLKSLKLIHHLRDHGYPEQDMFQAIRQLLDKSRCQRDLPLDDRTRDRLDSQKVVLYALRDLSRDHAAHDDGRAL